MDHFMYFIEQNFLNMFHSGIWIVHNNVCYYPPFPIKKKKCAFHGSYNWDF